MDNMTTIKHETSNLTTKTSQVNFEKSKKAVMDQLQEGEHIELYIKGANIDMLDLGTATMVTNLSATFGKSNDIGFNYSVFITNKRVFVNDTNYCDDELSYSNTHRIYNREDIAEIKFNKEKLTKTKLSFGQKTKKFFDLFIKNYVYGSGSLISWYVIQGMFQKIITGNVNFADIQLVPSLLSAVVVLGVAIIVVKKTALSSRVKIRTKDNHVFDMIVVNSDAGSVLKYLKSMNV